MTSTEAHLPLDLDEQSNGHANGVVQDSPDFAAMDNFDPLTDPMSHFGELNQENGNGHAASSIEAAARTAMDAEQTPAAPSVMSNAQRREANAVVNATTPVEMPEDSMTRAQLLARPGIERAEAFRQAKEAAAADLERDKAAREQAVIDRKAAQERREAAKAEAEARQQARDEKTIVAEQDRYVASKTNEIDAEVDEAMATKHADLKAGSVDMMRANLREQTARRVAEERRATVAANGGVKGIDKLIQRERAEAAAEAARVAAEEARAEAERQATKDRLTGFVAKGGVVIPRKAPSAAGETGEAPKDEPIRPPLVSARDWLTMGERARRQMNAAEAAEGIDSKDPEVRALQGVAALERQYGKDLTGMSEQDQTKHQALAERLNELNKDSKLDREQIEATWRAHINAINVVHDYHNPASSESNVGPVAAADAEQTTALPAATPAPEAVVVPPVAPTPPAENGDPASVGRTYEAPEPGEAQEPVDDNANRGSDRPAFKLRQPGTWKLAERFAARRARRSRR